MSEHTYISHDEFETSQREMSRALEKLELRIESQLTALKKARAEPQSSKTSVVDYSLVHSGLASRIDGLENQYFELAILIGKIGRTVEVLAASVEKMAGIE